VEIEKTRSWCIGMTKKLIIVDNLLSSDTVNIPDDPAVEFRFGSITDDRILRELPELYVALPIIGEVILFLAFTINTELEAITKLHAVADTVATKLWQTSPM